MFSDSSIFKIHFLSILIVFHVAVVVIGISWIWWETQTRLAEANVLRVDETKRCKKMAEDHVQSFLNLWRQEAGEFQDAGQFLTNAEREIATGKFGETGFLFIISLNDNQFHGWWKGAERELPVSSITNSVGKPFLDDGRVACLSSRRGVWLENVSVTREAGNAVMSFYLLPDLSNRLVVGAGLNMAETRRNAKTYLDLSQQHIKRFIAGMLALLIFLILGTFGVTMLLARKVGAEFKGYAMSLKSALESGKPVEVELCRVREFRQLATTTNELMMERAKALRQLEVRESQYQHLFETSAISLWLADFSKVKEKLEELKSAGISNLNTYLDEHPEFVDKLANTIQLLDVNEEGIRMYEAEDKETLLSHNALFGSDRKVLIQLLEGLSSEEEVVKISGNSQTLKGRDLEVLIYIRAVEAGDLNHLHISVVDVSELNRAQEDLANEKEKLAATIQSIGDAVVVTSSSGRIEMMNEEAGRLTGFDPDQAIGYPLEQIYRVVMVGNDHEMDESVGVFFKAEALELAGEERVITALDGKKCLIEESRAPVVDKKGHFKGMVLVFRDVTDSRKTKALLSRAKRLESLGLLAAGIAHDFNNVMTAVFGNISLARMFSEPDSKVAEKLNDAERAIEKARELTSRLITFSQGGTPVSKPVKLSDVIRTAVEKTLGDAPIEVIFRIPDASWQVGIDAAQFVHVVDNIVRNAMEAVGDDGRIEITAEATTIEQGDTVVEPGCYIQLSFQDNGCGILEDDLSRVFDPYFTTKKSAQGLGLSIVYGIVHRHNGYVTVNSIPGKGSRFDVFLPCENCSPHRENLS